MGQVFVRYREHHLELDLLGYSRDRFSLSSHHTLVNISTQFVLFSLRNSMYFVVFTSAMFTFCHYINTQWYNAVFDFVELVSATQWSWTEDLITEKGFLGILSGSLVLRNGVDLVDLPVKIVFPVLTESKVRVLLVVSPSRHRSIRRGGPDRYLTLIPVRHAVNRSL